MLGLSCLPPDLPVHRSVKPSLKPAGADNKELPGPFGAMVIVLNGSVENDQFSGTGATICAAGGNDMIIGTC